MAYRDLKPENLLIGHDGHLRLTDFGFAKKIEPSDKTFTLCGTPVYLAPEIIKDTGYEGYFVDIWSLGVLLFAMLTGTVPFKAPNLE